MTNDVTALSLAPRSVESPTDAGATFVGGLDEATPARVDGGGLVTRSGANWSLDWWIGADDRWHLPAREAAVRQRRNGYGPIIETSVRIPSGDAIQTVYPVMVGGRTMTVIEVRNDSPVPVALAMAIRPVTAEGESPGGSQGGSPGGFLGIELVDSTMISVDGDPALILPRPPNEAGAATDRDLLDSVIEGATLQWDGPVAGPMANAIVLYPLPHRTSLRFVVPPSQVGNGGGLAGLKPEELPDADSSANGWTTVIERAGRFEFPDSGVTELAGAARARLLLATHHLADSILENRSGAGLLVEALAAGGHRRECVPILQQFAASFPVDLGDGPAAAAEVLVGIARAAATGDGSDLFEDLLAPAAQLTRLAERSKDKAATAKAFASLAVLTDLAGQKEAAADLVRRSQSISQSKSPSQSQSKSLSNPNVVAKAPNVTEISQFGERAAPARRWLGSGRGTAGFAADLDGSDSALEAARYWLAARRLLVDDHPMPSVDGASPIDLLVNFASAWRGGVVEVHEAVVFGGRLSFAIRWHGYRPALLWELSPASDWPHPIVLRCPSLDPSWSTGELRGETLLAASSEELPPSPQAGDSFS